MGIKNAKFFNLKLISRYVTSATTENVGMIWSSKYVARNPLHGILKYFPCPSSFSVQELSNLLSATAREDCSLFMYLLKAFIVC